MQIGDLVQLKKSKLLNRGLGVVVEISDYEGWTKEEDSKFFRVMWGNDPYQGKVKPEDWIYCLEDLEIVEA